MPSTPGRASTFENYPFKTETPSLPTKRGGLKILQLQNPLGIFGQQLFQHIFPEGRVRNRSMLWIMERMG